MLFLARELIGPCWNKGNIPKAASKHVPGGFPLKLGNNNEVVCMAIYSQVLSHALALSDSQWSDIVAIINPLLLLVMNGKTEAQKIQMTCSLPGHTTSDVATISPGLGTPFSSQMTVFTSPSEISSNLVLQIILHWPIHTANTHKYDWQIVSLWQTYLQI